MAVGAVKILAKLGDIFGKIKDAVRRAKAALKKGRTGCFAFGTVVLLATGEFIPIEEVDVGDVVAAAVQPATPGLPEMDVDATVSATPRSVYEGALHTIVVETTGGQRVSITGTPEHPFWSVDAHRWVALADLAVGCRLDGIVGDVVVVGHEVAFGAIPVANLGVECAHCYRVTEAGVLAHNGCGIWSSTKSKSAVENAFGHWKKHGSEFPEFESAKQYVDGANRFVTSPPAGTLTKTRPNGDTLFYNPGSNTFAVRGADGAPRTMFRPDAGMNYWNGQ